MWPGRLELLTVDGNDILLDGAHNPAGAAALAQALDDLRPHLTTGPLTLVMAAMADKDVDGIIDALTGASALLGARVIATSVAAPGDTRRQSWPNVGVAPRGWRRSHPWRTRSRPWSGRYGAADQSSSPARSAAGRSGPASPGRRPRAARSTGARMMTNPLPATRIGPQTFAWGERTFVMGILNVTPDSFSGDGLLRGGDPITAAVEQARRMVEEGADILDVGGESTRPGHAPVEAAEEIGRVIPVLARSVGRYGVPLGIDTTKAVVAEAALAAGAHLLNDIWGVGADPAMAELAASAGVPLLVCTTAWNRATTTWCGKSSKTCVRRSSAPSGPGSRPAI